MWNRRKDEEPPQRTAPQPAPPAPAPTQSREAHPTMPNPPSYDSQQPATGGSATIGKAVMIKGQIFSREDLVIDGEIEGTVEATDHRVTVGPNGKVHAGVKAREIVVLGAITGNVEAAEKIDIRKDAKLVGDIKTTRIVIEDGAYFKGSIDIIKPDAKPQVPPPRERAVERSVQTAAAAPAVPAPPVTTAGNQ